LSTRTSPRILVHQAVVLGFFLEQLIGFVSEADGALR
jgi:hypothetical protein